MLSVWVKLRYRNVAAVSSMLRVIGQTHFFNPPMAAITPPMMPPRVSPMIPTVPYTKPTSPVVSPSPPLSIGSSRNGLISLSN